MDTSVSALQKSQRPWPPWGRQNMVRLDSRPRRTSSWAGPPRCRDEDQAPRACVPRRIGSRSVAKVAIRAAIVTLNGHPPRGGSGPWDSGRQDNSLPRPREDPWRWAPPSTPARRGWEGTLDRDPIGRGHPVGYGIRAYGSSGHGSKGRPQPLRLTAVGRKCRVKTVNFAARRKAMKRSAVLAIVACLTAGCAFGQTFPAYRAKELVKGKTTEEQALKILGEPLERFIEGNKATWVYLHGSLKKSAFYFLFFSVEGVTSAETARLKLEFVDGLLQNYDFATTFAPPGSSDAETFHGVPERLARTPEPPPKSRDN